MWVAFSWGHDTTENRSHPLFAVLSRVVSETVENEGLALKGNAFLCVSLSGRLFCAESRKQGVVLG